ncbi:MAG: hypothetical protein ABI364_07620, partial [Caldimonas sp.]
MAFVMIAAGTTSRSRVRTISVPPLVLLALLAVLMSLAAGGALGYWLAGDAPAPPARATTASAQATLPFTLEQVGAISGRLFRLESEAAQLSKRIGALGPAAPPRAAREPSKDMSSASS